MVRPWTSKAIFKLSRYSLESLERVISEFDAGIFLLAPDDAAVIRGRQRRVVRDNVIFELGMFVGALGRERSFLVAPKTLGATHLPTDLLGLTYAGYGRRSAGQSWQQLLEPACEQIKESLKDISAGTAKRRNLRVDRIDFFNEFGPTFEALLRSGRHLTTFFIHSRRWREMHVAALRKFLQKKGSSWTAILPHPKDGTLYRTFQRNFEDGPQIPGFVLDAYRFCWELQRESKGRVRILMAHNYPTYSFYVCDRTIIAAMYPTTQRKKSVPTFQVSTSSEFGSFVMDDLERLLRSSKVFNHSMARRLGLTNNS